MAVVWDKALYDLAYVVDAEPEGHPNTREGIKLHYNRGVMFQTMLLRAQMFVEHLALTQADRIIVVGCGFGWTVEALQGMGLTVVGCDISGYIQGNKSTDDHDEVDAAVRSVGLDPTTGEGLEKATRLKRGVRATTVVLNENSSSNASRNRVKTALGSDPTIIITEEVVTSLTDTECVALQTNLDRYAPGVRVCHFLTELANPNPPFNLNSKTAEAWKAIFPTATIIAVGGKEKVL